MRNIHLCDFFMCKKIRESSGCFVEPIFFTKRSSSNFSISCRKTIVSLLFWTYYRLQNKQHSHGDKQSNIHF